MAPLPIPAHAEQSDVQTSALTSPVAKNPLRVMLYSAEMLVALVAADLDFESTGTISCETMKLIRDLLAEMGVA